jgi:hypothetical protein
MTATCSRVSYKGEQIVGYYGYCSNVRLGSRKEGVLVQRELEEPSLGTNHAWPMLIPNGPHPV